MEMVSPVYAALGVVGFDALTELAGWLDGRVEPKAPDEKSAGDRILLAAGRPAGREG